MLTNKASMNNSNNNKNSDAVCIVNVAVPVPLRQSFDFIIPQLLLSDELKQKITQNDPSALHGCRVKVPFGPRHLIGVIIGIKAESEYPQNKLKPIVELLDTQTIFDASVWQTLLWISRYYLAPIGEVIEAAMPVHLRQGSVCTPGVTKTWRLSEVGRSSSIDDLQRAPLQLAIVKRFMQSALLSSNDFKSDSSSWRQAIKALVEKGWVEEFTTLPTLTAKSKELKAQALRLNQQQQNAVDTLLKMVSAESFSCTLLQGVTGSGKTEVYFAAMKAALNKNQQVLLLVPEIGLTPQLIERVEKEFTQPIAVMHSGLNDTERHLAWWHARQGNAKIVIGTRSAVFSSFAELGLIVIDEEHDGSFKQQDGVRYQARDVAIYRAKQHNIPIILGSATPSLESYANATAERYQHIRLTERASKIELPKIELFDLTRLPSSDGLSPAMLEAIRATLDTGKQVMLFLNRRGYAPVMYCTECRETSKCHRCDSHLTLHRRINRVRCHHCGYEAVAQKVCGSCKSDSMVEVGEGTQRVEEAIQLRFPDARLLRIDRDSTRRKGELEALLTQARDGEADILLGTQLITKGHDFPNLSMVGILEADQGLYSTDFRASETLFQQVLQVAGRAGRRESLGRVFIQTHFVNHPFFDWVKSHDYDGFAQSLLDERKIANFPPYGFFALLRAESTHQAKALQFLRRAKRDIIPADGVHVMDAVPAPMERRAGKYRAQLLITAEQRSTLNASLSAWLDYLANDKEAKKLSNSVRWSVDIDPLDHY